MSLYSRRSILKFFGSLPVVIPFAGCARAGDSSPQASGAVAKSQDDSNLQTSNNLPSALEMSNSKRFKPGYLSIVQGPTSDTESLINVVAPRLKNYVYEVTDAAGASLPVNKYDTVRGPLFYNVDKIKVSGLVLGKTYTLQVKDGKTVVDERQFSALDVRKTEPNFALVSCMADDVRFSDAIEPMWKRLQDQNVDFIIMCGDSVYVDSFEFVPRERATEIDIWQRYTDSLRRIPLYHFYNLKPIFAAWDDHDYGTNDGDRTFVGREAADRLFKAVFLGAELPGVWSEGPNGTASVLNAFGQKFYLMDDRTFRQPNKNQVTQEAFGHWGEAQHAWVINDLKQSRTPAWLINGNQFFAGVKLDFKEAFEQNDPAEFATLLSDLRTVNAPVVFASGDVHLSEIMKVPADRVGYETFELTSSAMHSYSGTGWENPMRIPGAYTIEFNFMVVRSKAVENGIDMDVTCLGLAQTPYFQNKLSIRK